MSIGSIVAVVAGIVVAIGVAIYLIAAQKKND